MGAAHDKVRRILESRCVFRSLGASTVAVRHPLDDHALRLGPRFVVEDRQRDRIVTLPDRLRAMGSIAPR